jgi:hypothetical protein
MKRKKRKTNNFSIFFQHFPSLSRNQDDEGDNTLASDERGGRNFHLPNICTIIFPPITKLFCNRFISLSVFFFKHLVFALIHLC